MTVQSNAERQRAYRARHRNDETPPAVRVTLRVTKPESKEWYPAFLAAFRNSGIVRASCQAAGIDRHTFYAARATDADFLAAYEDAKADALDLIEAALRQRALQMDTTAAIYLMKVLGGDEWRRDRLPPEITVFNDNRSLGAGALTLEDLEATRTRLRLLEESG